MSGIVGIVQFDGSPIDPALLGRLTDSLAFRGPDARHTWIKNGVGLGHTLFRTTDESGRERQPLTLDDKTWIVADARIDAREELFAALRSAGESDFSESIWTDAELILRAYRVWAGNCVEHLLGDFAFGIWDALRQELFCARDHMGVKPFYYAQVGPCVIFSNTLDCIRRHPLISDKLNDLAIADFLLFGHNQDRATTSFADIQRIPPAHCVTCSHDGFSIRRYWSMPIDEPLLYRRPDDYIDHFHHLLRKSVADRFRTRRVWVFMSGGIDSTALAATARELTQERDADFDLRAFTRIDSFVPEEARYAGATAKYLGIPIVYRYWTEDVDLRWEQVSFSTPEPVPHSWFIPTENKLWQEITSHSRVFFHGEGPDNALRCEWRPYSSHLLKQRKYMQLVRSSVATLLTEKRPPFWGRIAKRFEGGAHFANDSGPTYPEWLNPSFEARLDIRARWSSVNTPPAPLHPHRPIGYASLHIPLWQAMFEGFDAGVTKSSFEVRHPFVDIRMLRFLLSVPSLPWCRSKYLLRRAMRGHLPNDVLFRPKTTPDLRSFCRYLTEFCQLPFIPVPHTSQYISGECFRVLPNLADVEINLRARSLNHWLQNLHGNSDNLEERSPCDRFPEQTAPTV